MARHRQFSKETLAEWLAQPLTQTFLQYLKDRRNSLGSLWMQGTQMSPEAQTEARLLSKLSALDWDDIDQFYSREAETETDPQGIE